MKKNSRVYAAIHLDALEQNLENMKKNLTPGTRMIGVIKANAYGHGAVPVAHLMLSLIHISEPTRLRTRSRMPSSA